jgi:DNA-binding CsgD family transcriptional regulator
MKTNVQTLTTAFINIWPKSDTDNDQYSSFVPESNKETILQHLHFAETIFPQCGIMLCPVSHVDTQYVSLNCAHILGHDHEELNKNSLAEFFSLVHPEDLQPIQQCLAYMKSLTPFDPTTYRFFTYYRVRNKDGDYAHIRNEHFSIKTESNTYLYLMLFSNVSAEEKFYHVKMDVHKIVKGNLLKVNTYNPQQEEKEITPRQNDIAQLIIRGFTNQQIADQLNVSIFTVKNHKQILFKRVNVRNSIELANYVRVTH